MGIGFVIISWLVIGSIAAVVGSLTMGGIASYLTRNVDGGKNRAALGALCFPPACFLWVVTVFIFQAFINVGMLNRDCGLGDGFWCPLPNGYELAAIDTTDDVSVFKQHAGVIGDEGMSQEDAIGGVTQLQASDHYLLGCIGGTKELPEAFKKFAQVEDREDEFFVLDCRSGEKTTLATYKDLCQTASRLGIKLALQSANHTYYQYRFTIFDYCLVPLILLPMITGFALLVRQILRFRSRPPLASTPPTVL